MSQHNDKTMCAILDRYTAWIGAYLSPTRTTHAIVNTLQDLIGRRETCNLLYFDNAKQYIAATKHANNRHDTRMAKTPASNGVAERAVRRFLKGTSSVLLGSGLQHCYWAEAAPYCAFIRNVTADVRDKKKTACHLHHNGKFGGHIIPFDALVKYLPTSKRDILERGKSNANMIPGICLGDNVGIGGCWIEVRHVMDAAAYEEGHYTSPVPQLEACDVNILDDKLIFPVNT